MNDDDVAAHLEHLHEQHRPITTADVNNTAIRIIDEFETFRHQVISLFITVGGLFVIVGAGICWLVMSR